MSEQLWCRVGDASDYRTCELDNAADEMAELGATGPVDRVQGGIITPQFSGNNYVSLYWGDKESNHVRDIDDAELDELRDQLSRAVRERSDG